MPNSLSTYLEFVIDTIYAAGRITLGYFQTGIKPDIKRDNSPVTIADRLSEELIRSRIEKHFPGHSIVGEEFGVSETSESEIRWFVDPIDGTKSFIRGVPLYAVLLGLEIDGKVVAGAAYFPALDEMIAAATGLGCWWNGRRTYVSKVDQLHQATVCFTDIANFQRAKRQEAWARIQSATHFQAGWGDAYGYLLVATGRAEIMLDPIMSVWDCGPFPPILQEAGGYFGDWKGNATIYGNEGCATSKILLPEVLRILA